MTTCKQCKNAHWDSRIKARHGFGDGTCIVPIPQWIDWSGSPILDFDTDATRCDSFEQVESDEK